MVARYCVWEKMDVQDAGEVDWNPASRGSDTWDRLPPVDWETLK